MMERTRDSKGEGLRGRRRVKGPTRSMRRASLGSAAWRWVRASAAKGSLRVRPGGVGMGKMIRVGGFGCGGRPDMEGDEVGLRALGGVFRRCAALFLVQNAFPVPIIEAGPGNVLLEARYVVRGGGWVLLYSSFSFDSQSRTQGKRGVLIDSSGSAVTGFHHRVRP